MGNDAALSKEVRKLLGLNQKDFAKKLGVAPITVSNWEQGVSSMSPRNYTKVLRLKYGL